MGEIRDVTDGRINHKNCLLKIQEAVLVLLECGSNSAQPQRKNRLLMECR